MRSLIIPNGIDVLFKIFSKDIIESFVEIVVIKRKSYEKLKHHHNNVKYLEDLDKFSFKPFGSSKDYQNFTAVLVDNFPFKKNQFSDDTYPDLRKYYPLIRNLYLKGFKNFEVWLSNQKKYKFVINRLLDEFENKYKNQTCYILGNGPSLKDVDISKIDCPNIFGSNQIFLHPKAKFNFWCIEDKLQIEKYKNEFLKNINGSSINFVPFEYILFFNPPNACFYNHIYEYDFFPKVAKNSKKLYMGGSVTYVMLQISGVMGFKEINLLGIDHRYNLDARRTRSIYDYNLFFYRFLEILKILSRKFAIFKKINSKILQFLNIDGKLWSSNDTSAQTHFSKEYASGKLFTRFRPKRVELAYKKINQLYKKKNIKIINLTKNSNLKIFDTL